MSYIQKVKIWQQNLAMHKQLSVKRRNNISQKLHFPCTNKKIRMTVIVVVIIIIIIIC